MKIIILGAGQVGSSVAANLCNEANDITVVDRNPACLQALQDRFDLRGIVGHGSHPDILSAAGAQDADMIIALTNSDETNMIACQVAYTLFRTPTKIARIREVQYQKATDLFAQEALPIDVLISPEQEVTDYIRRLIEFPGALQVLDFAHGRVQLVAARAFYGGPLVGHRLNELPEQLPGVETRVVAIYRRHEPIIPNGATVIETGDDVFFVAAPKHIRAVMSEFQRLDSPNKRVLVAGGGNIGKRLAIALEKHCSIKIIESDRERAQQIAEELKHAYVLLGDAADEDLLVEENVEQIDVFCALTNADEANIISSMLAKRLGAKTVMALINRAAYVDLVQRDIIDIAISPQQATIGSLLAHVRRGDVVKVHALRRGAAEAIEAIAHGDRNSSQVVGRPLDNIELPPGTTIGAIVRGDAVIMAHHDTVIEAEDHVIMIVTNKRHVRDVERLFQVSVTFL
ncbi:MAG: Trk system potassium transporter TrkA [Gammaproteobacteria bacterium]|jgi:trk system potassium uptake protein TrkA|nr:Trk system potassium transporter TrkA [Gammaproteobacteria bacterium]HJP36266.1 Trk system potassium transporter TrkA [Gammaproteobacteria bacterium]